MNSELGALSEREIHWENEIQASFLFHSSNTGPIDAKKC